MYPAGVSARRIEGVSEILWGVGASAGTVSNLNEKAFESVDAWRTRPLSGGYPYLFVDGVYLKRSWGGSYENVAVMVAIGVNSEGRREIAGRAEGFAESREFWKEFPLRPRGRGLSGVRLVTGDKSLGMLGALEEVFPRRGTSGAPSASTATCSARCRGRSGRGSPRCSRPSMHRNRARRRRRRRPRWPARSSR